MNAKTTLAAVALLAAAATVAAHPYLESRTPIAGTIVDIPQAFSLGTVLCDNTAPGPLQCSIGGLGGAHYDVSHFDAHGATQVEGSCHVQKSASSLGDLPFICGSDRDDDAFVTSQDFTGDQDSAGTGHGTSAAFDDQFYSGLVPSGTVAGSIPVCFTHDADGAGHDWDYVAVFLVTNVPGGYAGPAATVLSLDDRATDC